MKRIIPKFNLKNKVLIVSSEYNAKKYPIRDYEIVKTKIIGKTTQERLGEKDSITYLVEEKGGCTGWYTEDRIYTTKKECEKWIKQDQEDRIKSNEEANKIERENNYKKALKTIKEYEQTNQN